ncbi:uncharacterized protein M421DRAFT_390963 [Didymella exigua CBS 183.55]|uniref:Uncharacterized protein n=1 Tax=Didymella exigua CBS 183.55 TaxID=1150837 RepID=A0A6A5RUN3_9PLEO|nr:uncharacterized protein M421DRAFT_390963 [Didymella exigua CBS 183.55]KAF1929067.1 hypothetical protein M421DRAFT_390963 [Didymella exigua CBS 183.55]
MAGRPTLDMNSCSVILNQTLHHPLAAIDYSFLMAMALMFLLTSCGSARLTIYTSCISQLMLHNCSSLWILLLSMFLKHAIATRSKLSLHLMTQHLSRRTSLLYHITRQEKKLYQSGLYELAGVLLAFAIQPKSSTALIPSNWPASYSTSS